jgi:hypothetical protein
LAATAEQMSKLSRALLDSMDRFATEETHADQKRSAARRHPAPVERHAPAEYAEMARS